MVALAIMPAIALAHSGGGVPKLVAAQAGPYLVFGFVSSDPPRAEDTVHLGVAVVLPGAQEGVETAVADARVTLILSPDRSSGETLTVPAPPGALLGYYEADTRLPNEGNWRVTIQVAGPLGSGEVFFPQYVKPALDPPNSFINLSPLVIPAIFVLSPLALALTVFLLIAASRILPVGRRAFWIRIGAFVAAVLVIGVALFSLIRGDANASSTVTLIDPSKLDEPSNPFSHPALRQIADKQYEVYLVAQSWKFAPEKITVPVGSKVTFHVTARDIMHGFKLLGTDINLLALPGKVTTKTVTFDKPGVYSYVCDKVCSTPTDGKIGHYIMYGQILVADPG